VGLNIWLQVYSTPSTTTTRSPGDDAAPLGEASGLGAVVGVPLAAGALGGGADAPAPDGALGDEQPKMSAITVVARTARISRPAIVRIVHPPVVWIGARECTLSAGNPTIGAFHARTEGPDRSWMGVA
jgi:hypothetical protein